MYATGGRGNSRLVAWEGERTLTFTMEDALISPESFSILSGAGLIEADEAKPVYVHTTSQIELMEDNTIVLPEKAAWNGYPKKDGANDEYYHASADIFIMEMQNGQIIDEPCIPAKPTADGKVSVVDTVDADGNTVSKITCYGHHGKLAAGTVVIVDYYVKRTSNVQVIEITPDKFGGNYYLEASTLFRDEASGVDMPAEFIIPNCKVQSNFTFTMAATGDPSTFTFTMDAFPDYTKFDRSHKVLAAIQVITDNVSDTEEFRTPCEPEGTFKQAATCDKATGATAKVTSDSATACAISVTGSGVTENAQGTEMFDANDELTNAGVKAVVLDFNMPVDEAGGTYHVKQTNPALKHYFGTDNRVTKEGTKYVKNADYPLAAGEPFELSILITEETDTATVELSKAGTTIKTYTITENVAFA